MDEEPANASSEAGLHEYVDAKFTIEGIESPTREKALSDAVKNLPGLITFSIFHGSMTAHYDPALLSGKGLEEAIRSAGFQISETHATDSSPLTDALKEENKPAKNS